MITSVHRVFLILEAFRAAGRPLSNKEVADMIDSAPSSSLALLRSMTDAGYLRFDPETKQYSVSLRLTVLADGFGAASISSGLRRVITAVWEETGETVSLSVRNGREMVVLQSILGRFPIISNIPTGARIGVTSSAIGLAALAAEGDDETIRSVLADIADNDFREKAQSLINDARRNGYLIAHGLWFHGHGVVATPIALDGGRETVIIGVGGPTDRIAANAASMAEACRGAIARHIRTDE